MQKKYGYGQTENKKTMGLVKELPIMSYLPAVVRTRLGGGVKNGLHFSNGYIVG